MTIFRQRVGLSTDSMLTRYCVVHLITRLELGGAQKITLDEALLSQFGERPTYVMTGPGGLLDGAAKQLPGVEFIPIPSLVRAVSAVNDIRALFEIRAALRRIRRLRPDCELLVHTHSSKAGILGRIAARLAGVRLVVHSIHGFGHNRSGSPVVQRIQHAAEFIAGRLTDGFTADSAANIEQGRRERLLGKAQAEVVYCGIDVDAFTRDVKARDIVRQSLGISSEDVVVINVACLKPQKDPLAYVEVAARVLERRPATTFLLVGDGELRPQVEARANELGLASRFRMLGWRHDVADLMGASDLLVLTSRWEGLPQTFFQAMAASLPIVATRVDGAPEAISHGTNGYLYAVDELEPMVSGIVELIDSPTLRRTFGANGHRLAEKFDVSASVERLDRFYRDLAAAVRSQN